MKNHKNFVNTFEEVKQCPICYETNNLIELYLIKYANLNVPKILSIESCPDVFLLKCNNCCHCFASHKINCSMLDRYYSKINSVLYSNWSENPKDNNEKKHQKLANEIDKLFPNGEKILDIGCGCGFVLKSLKNDKWDLYGIEPSPYASAIATRNKIKILSKDIHTVGSLNFKFNVILMLDVIEHLSNPNIIISEALRMLDNDGLLIIETGDIHSANAIICGSNWNYFCSYEHISFYTKTSIKHLLRSHNMKSIKIKNVSHHPSLFANGLNLLQNIAKRILLRGKYNFTGNLAFDHIRIYAHK